MDIRRFFATKNTPVSDSSSSATVAATEAAPAPDPPVPPRPSTSHHILAPVGTAAPAACNPCETASDGGQLPSDLGDKSVGPKQPVLPVFPRHKIGDRNRCFSAFFYNKHPWLEYSVSRDAVFCFCCRHFSKEIGEEEDTLAKQGGRYWSKLTERLIKHSSSEKHKACMRLWEGYKETEKHGSVRVHLSTSHQNTVDKNREYLTKVLDVVKLLSQLGLPFRGHREIQWRKKEIQENKNEKKHTNTVDTETDKIKPDDDDETKGNFLSLCNFLGKYEPSFRKMQDEKYFNCTSPDFQNEVISLCAELVREEIANAVRETGFFTVIADEAKSSKSEQLSVCIRYAEKLQVKERLICFIDCSASRDAAGIVEGIKKGLESCGLQDRPNSRTVV